MLLKAGGAVAVGMLDVSGIAIYAGRVYDGCPILSKVKLIYYFS
jgi:hypothetical protein